MPQYNLTPKQKDLLISIVSYIKQGKLIEPFLAVCTQSGCRIVSVEKDFGRNLIGDLDALVDAGLIGFSLTSMGSRSYSVKKSGYDAIDNNFASPEGSSGMNVNIGAYINSFMGGNIQAVGYANNSEIISIVNDPVRYSQELENITNNLIDEVKSELEPEKLIAYIKAVTDLKQELLSEKPSTSKLKKFFASLSFLADIEGAFSLVVRVLPYIYPLIQLAIQKIQ